MKLIVDEEILKTLFLTAYNAGWANIKELGPTYVQGLYESNLKRLVPYKEETKESVHTLPPVATLKDSEHLLNQNEYINLANQIMDSLSPVVAKSGKAYKGWTTPTPYKKANLNKNLYSEISISDAYNNMGEEIAQAEIIDAMINYTELPLPVAAPPPKPVAISAGHPVLKAVPSSQSTSQNFTYVINYQ